MEQIQVYLQNIQNNPLCTWLVISAGLFGITKALFYAIPGPHHQPKLNVREKTVLITGASTGLGRALAFKFYKEGAKVIVTARSIDKLKSLCDELIEYLTDTKDDSIKDLVKKSITGDKIDVLVNNAGLSNRGSCRDTSLKVQRDVMEINYFGHVAVTKNLIDFIPDDGAIVVISSLQGRIAIPYRSAYSASKHAIQAFFDSMRGEERPNLQILVVSAGYMNTGFGSRAVDTEGVPVNIEDENQKKGYSPELCANYIYRALVDRKNELILAPLIHRIAIFIRWFSPNLYFWITYIRSKKERGIGRKIKKDE
ncbi:Dehydrogenase/reductase SDR family member 7B [Strongyloides ratti]|uniref:Dehydrogenase/reductase SDR family member 7B n=1 Tax=Strongyloides ratti TaxID=34506 RepID=A0A090LA99_STRRB|nr:Dehydrogenase/reductase SDR family member 7B [Strongyloides ratti]CEF65068.1 Dehydrogenase/reductase SDR family member 7B [Strongyloides ratti]